MQHFYFFLFVFFFSFSVQLFFVHHPLYFSCLSPAPSDCLAVCQSVRPPDGLIQAARSTYGRGGIAVAAVGLHAIALGVQARIHQAVGPSGARGPRTGQQAGWGALAPSIPWCHHGELVGSRACAVIQVRVGLEVLGLVV